MSVLKVSGVELCTLGFQHMNHIVFFSSIYKIWRAINIQCVFFQLVLEMILIQFICIKHVLIFKDSVFLSKTSVLFCWRRWSRIRSFSIKQTCFSFEISVHFRNNRFSLEDERFFSTIKVLYFFEYIFLFSKITVFCCQS